MDLEKLLKQKQEQRNNLLKSIQGAETREALDKIELDIRKVDMEIEELKAKIEAQKDQDPAARSSDNEPVGGFNPISTYKTNSQSEQRKSEDLYGTMEYRQAFRNYVINGTPIPDEFKQEERADSVTTVADIGAVIPTTIMNKVIEDMTIEGKILSRVTQTSYQGGVAIPISEVNPEAIWLADENTVSDEQKAKMEAKVTFSYHVLEAKVAIGLLTSTVSLPIFEATVIKQLKKAMIRAIETAIVSGDGSGKPLGFTKVELPTKQTIDMTVEDMGTVSKWAEIEANIPEVSEDSVIYVMSKATWEKYLNGMTDKNGQKIGLGKINEKGQKILNGREVLTVDKLPSFDAAKTGDIFGAVIDLNNYMLNSNLNMYYKKYFNEDKNKWIHKALMIADGKMAVGKDSKNNLVGAQGLIYLKKKTSV
ncbi:phage major capsid protein [Clostridium sporogenes]|uniref:Phage major capsid protein n=1 Tax=Clostridium sporogenes TaxID=1509 RepID=A0AAE4JVF0_CLOSG|nr:phage major capsid protein [Clostridium sporogenes]MDS1005303.1 phage major capsid protein [Clostridium sporogenes]